ncbi:hypothetical protein E2C01_080617 [Portunus trituberculatus]|uniref:Uncharacterized protein n=1 Tax=Portunus trituberculatus TaxID=210409 RepID=A0A5B7IMN4_PORTR|nr:hypothetical protein [Portunus trituberculatus]
MKTTVRNGQLAYELVAGRGGSEESGASTAPCTSEGRVSTDGHKGGRSEKDARVGRVKGGITIRATRHTHYEQDCQEGKKESQIRLAKHDVDDDMEEEEEEEEDKEDEDMKEVERNKQTYKGGK